MIKGHTLRVSGTPIGAAFQYTVLTHNQRPHIAGQWHTTRCSSPVYCTYSWSKATHCGLVAHQSVQSSSILYLLIIKGHTLRVSGTPLGAVLQYIVLTHRPYLLIIKGHTLQFSAIPLGAAFQYTVLTHNQRLHIAGQWHTTRCSPVHCTYS